MCREHPLKTAQQCSSHLYPIHTQNLYCIFSHLSIHYSVSIEFCEWKKKKKTRRHSHSIVSAQQTISLYAGSNSVCSVVYLCVLGSAVCACVWCVFDNRFVSLCAVTAWMCVCIAFAWLSSDERVFVYHFRFG